MFFAYNRYTNQLDIVDYLLHIGSNIFTTHILFFNENDRRKVIYYINSFNSTRNSVCVDNIAKTLILQQ